MFRVVLTSAALLVSGITAAQAEAGTQYVRSLGGSVTVAYQSRAPLAGRAQPGLLRIRDIQKATNGGGAGNGCWNACFNDFDECLGIRTKTLCVSRVKTCLETCDRLSNRPGM